MADNVFQHTGTTDSNVSSVATFTAQSFPTPSPIAVTTATVSNGVPALSFLYVIPYILFAVFTIVMISTARILRFYNVHCRKHRQHLLNGRTPASSEEEGDDADDDAENGRSTRHGISRRANSVAVGEATVVALGIRDRMKLYRLTFRRNKHCHTLTPQNFLHPKKNEVDRSLDFIAIDMDADMDADMDVDMDIESSGERNCALENKSDADNDCGDDYDDDDDDPSWIYLPLSPTVPKKEVDAVKDDDDDLVIAACDTCDTCHTRDTVDTCESDVTTTATTTITSSPTTADVLPLTKIPGTCIICFEKFGVGETVVWSDDTSICKHVFHEDCMVRFLATHSLRTKRASPAATANGAGHHSAMSSSYSDNSCPTCRQPFCAVSHDDLVMAVLLKSVAVALGEEEEDLPMFSRGGGEGSPFSSSERSQRIAATSFALASATIGGSTQQQQALVRQQQQYRY